MNNKNIKNKDIGRAGEELASMLLLQRGYHILARNFACRLGEIDIIAEKEGVLHFVEVKTRLTDTYGAGRLAVYLQSRTERWQELSFDLIEIRAEYLSGLAV